MPKTKKEQMREFINNLQLCGVDAKNQAAFADCIDALTGLETALEDYYADNKDGNKKPAEEEKKKLDDYYQKAMDAGYSFLRDVQKDSHIAGLTYITNKMEAFLEAGKKELAAAADVGEPSPLSERYKKTKYDFGSAILGRANAESGFFIGSRAFDNMVTALKAAEKSENALYDNYTMDNLNANADKYNKLIEQANKYLDMKKKQAEDLLKKGKAPSKNAIKRTDFAERLLQSAEKRLEVLNKVIDSTEVMKEKARAHMEKIQRSALETLKKPDEPNSDKGVISEEKKDALVQFYWATFRTTRIKNPKTQSVENLTYYEDSLKEKVMAEETDKFKNSAAFKNQLKSLKPEDLIKIAEAGEVTKARTREFRDAYQAELNVKRKEKEKEDAKKEKEMYDALLK